MEEPQSAKVLKAWQPYELALRCCRKLHNLDSPGDFNDWDIYWLAGLSACRSIWDSLKKELEKGSLLERSIWENFNTGPAQWEIHQDFTRSQRNRTLHEWAWDITTNPVKSYQWIGGKYIGHYTDLVFKYLPEHDGHEDVDEQLQGEDPIRLLCIALKFHHKNLSLIEIARENGNQKPFDDLNREKLYCGSSYFLEAPKFYR